MKRKTERKLWECPTCKSFVRDFPAISRRDNKTEICSDCGTREAMEDFMKAKMQHALDNKILNIVAFLAIMQGNGGLMTKSADYIYEKYRKFCYSTDGEEYKWGLDSGNTSLLQAWQKKWYK